MPRTVRPIRIEGDVAYVPLTKGYEAVIDAADVPLVEGFNWHAKPLGRSVYAARTQMDQSGRKTMVFLHRVVMTAPNGLDVDHRDGDGLNNRRCNLRTATRAQNLWNQCTRSSNTSGYKGVNWHRRSQRWEASIRHDGKRHWLGFFATAEAAHSAYVAASSDLHKDFGRLA